MGDVNVLLLVLNIVGVVVFIGIAFLFSKDKKNIPWVSVGVILAINVILALFFLKVPIGQDAIRAATDGFTALVNAAHEGTKFAFSDALTSFTGMLGISVDNPDAFKAGDPQMVAATTTAATAYTSKFVFFASALLPIIVIVPLFDILTYIGVLPWIIRIIGKAVSFVTREPKFESFFAIEMMFLGNTEAAAASKFQIVKLSKERVLTLAMMSMSCVTAALIGVYTTMLPGAYILTAIPLNVLNALMITSILNPVKVSKEEDEIATLYEEGEEREPFFSYLGNSILASGRLVLIICANVIAFVGLVAVINLLLGLFNPLIHMIPGLGEWNLSLESLFGLLMYIPAVLLGMPFGDPVTMDVAQAMGKKLVTNEFVVMGQLSTPVDGVKPIECLTPHAQCVITVFLTSFANFSTVGMIIGCFKGIVGDEENKLISQNVLLLFVSGIIVSLMSAAIAGLFVW